MQTAETRTAHIEEEEGKLKRGDVWRKMDWYGKQEERQ